MSRFDGRVAVAALSLAAMAGAAHAGPAPAARDRREESRVPVPATSAAPSTVGSPAAAPGDRRAAEGVTQLAVFTPERGFVDDPVAVDAGGHLAFIETDAARFATLVIVDGTAVRGRTALDQPADTPVSLALLGTGDASRVLVVRQLDDGSQRATLYDLAGKIVRKMGPASHVTLITRDGQPRLALHRTRPGPRNAVVHEIELVDPRTGRRAAPVRTLSVDKTGRNDKLGFRVNHWLDGWTRAAGLEDGRWEPKGNQRSPDLNAEYDLVAGRFAREVPIPDVAAYNQRMQMLAQRSDREAFVRVSDKGGELEIWRGGEPRAVAVDQPLGAYDEGSMTMAIDPGADAGRDPSTAGVWLGLRVDPVNRDAVKRHKADAEYLDLFSVDGGRATRRARLPVARRGLRWGVAGDRVWVVERNVGFDRGGASLTLYRVAR